MTDPDVLTYGREQETTGRRRVRRVAKWFWRIGLSMVTLAILLFGVAYVWTSHRLSAELSGLAAAGEPVTIDALAPPVLEDAENGYVDLQAAMRQLAVSKAVNRVDDLPGNIELPLHAHERLRLRAYVEENPGVLALLEAAAAKPNCVTTQPIPTALSLVNVKEYSAFRNAANFARHKALIDHDGGDDASAMRSLRPLQAVSEAASSYPSLIGHLVGAGIFALQSDGYLQLAAELRIGTRPGDASPQQVRDAIAMLLDNTPIVDSQTKGLRGERIYVLESFDQMQLGNFNVAAPGGRKLSAPLRVLARPWVRHNATVSVRALTDLLNASQSPDWAAAKVALRSARVPRSGDRIALLASLMTASLDRSLETRYRIETDRALAAVALALRLHEVETGRRATSLEALVPTYLPRVPADPLAGGQPLRAKLDGDAPIVWSVGPNGVDQGGDQTGFETFGDVWRTPDRVYSLVRWPRIIDEKTQRLIDLDLDASISATRPATIAGSTDETRTQLTPPIIENVSALNAGGDAAERASPDSPLAKLKTRRDLLAALASAMVSETPFAASDKGITGSFVEGPKDISPPMYFELAPDGTGVFRQEGRRDTPFDWSVIDVNVMDRELWR